MTYMKPPFFRPFAVDQFGGETQRRKHSIVDMVHVWEVAYPIYTTENGMDIAVRNETPNAMKWYIEVPKFLENRYQLSV